VLASKAVRSWVVVRPAVGVNAAAALTLQEIGPGGRLHSAGNNDLHFAGSMFS
jgi:hypothetical protein